MNHKRPKVLILTYYWPPSGGSGVQRFLFFVKYLREFGWEPVVFTMENADYPIIDEALKNHIPDGVEVIKTKSWEPYNLYRFFTLKTPNSKIPNNIAKNKSGFLHRLAVWVRGNFFIPDARKYWIKPSVKYLSEYLKENHIDVIVSTSPPQSTHLIALELAKQTKIPWIADFRDPWTQISYFKDLGLTKWAAKKHKLLEQKVLKNADKVTTVTWSWQNDFEKLSERKVDFLPNGFDDSKVAEILTQNKSDKFVITYSGVLSQDRNPIFLWNVLEELCNSVKGFKDKLSIVFVGDISIEIQDKLKQYSFFESIIFKGYLPHKEVFSFYSKSDILLLIGIPGIPGVLPGKVFEYIQAEKPVLSIGEKNSDVEKLLIDLNAGKHVDYGDKLLLKETLNNMWLKYCDKELQSMYLIDKQKLSFYTRRNLTQSLVKLLNELKV